jgi:putative flippase GtrA
VQNVGMRSIRALLAHNLTGPLIRYGIAGCCVAIVYLGVPLLLHDVAGLPIEVAIAIGYAVAIMLHFNLQRHFVFRHVDQFALTTRQQIGRYAMIAAVQYPTTALAAAFLPGLLHISSDAAFVVITLSISLTAFLMLRGHVFHPTVEEELIMEARAEDREHAAELSDDELERRTVDVVGS